MRAFKIILAAAVAILMAEFMGLEHIFSAGVIAILTIQPTKMETVHTALGRLTAFAVSLLLAFVCYGLMGFRVWGFLMFLALFIPLCEYFDWYHSISMNAVLMSHFVTYGNMNEEAVLNEVFIFGIGVSVGILANLHLKKREDYIERLKREADEQIIKILRLMSQRILDKHIPGYDEDCFQILEKQIRKAMNVAEENFNNQFRNDDIFDMEYIRMREQQCQILYEMYKNVGNLRSSPDTSETIAGFIGEMAEAYRRDNDGETAMKRFRDMNEAMKSSPLPATRKEFEDRARLFVLLRSIEEFIGIKVEFAQIHLDGKKE